MARQRRIIVRGKPRADIDPQALAQVLLAIAAEWERDDEQSRPTSPDVFDAAIEDNGPERQRGHR